MSEPSAINSRAEVAGKTIVVVGAGGNIGSHLVPHLGRLAGIARVVLIDGDSYEARNVAGQDITPTHVGASKAMVQAARLSSINPTLEVVAYSEPVEALPIRKLRGDIILACLDSRRARQYVNLVAWRLGIPWIDAGVEATGLLARVNVYLPGPASPCLECAWDQRDYEALEQAYPCQGAGEPAPTNAPSSLGALAASLQAIECHKLLGGFSDQVVAGGQVLIDALHHKHYVTSFRRNPSCRFSHEAWTINKLGFTPDLITVREAFGLAGRAVGLSVEGRRFVLRLTCPACGYVRSMLTLEPDRSCFECGGQMVATGADVIERIDGAALSPELLARSLESLGLRSGDVFTIESESGAAHFELL